MMAFKLDDNANEAFRFLMLGAGIILALRIVYWGADQWLFSTGADDPLTTAIAEFRNGYLISGNRTMVIGGMGLMGRFALALLTALGGALVFGSLSSVVAIAQGRDRLGAAVHGGRWGMFLVGTWCTLSVLFLPPRSSKITDKAFELNSRPALFGEMSLPWPSRSDRYPYTELTDLSERTISTVMDGCGSREQVIVHHGNDLIVIAQRVPTGPDCATSVTRARQHTSVLSDRIRRHLTRTVDLKDG